MEREILLLIFVNATKTITGQCSGLPWTVKRGLQTPEILLICFRALGLVLACHHVLGIGTQNKSVLYCREMQEVKNRQ